VSLDEFHLKKQKIQIFWGAKKLKKRQGVPQSFFIFWTKKSNLLVFTSERDIKKESKRCRLLDNFINAPINLPTFQNVEFAKLD